MQLRKIAASILAFSVLMTAAGAIGFAQETEKEVLYQEKFDFGEGKTGEGYKQVTKKTEYTPARGYGFTQLRGLTAGGSEDSEDAVKGDYIQATDAEEGLYFTVDVPDGDYTVKIVTGGDTATSANIYINEGERVRLYTLEAGSYQDNEQPVVPKDGKIAVWVKGDAAKVNAIEVTQLAKRTEKGEKPTIYIAGDSTAQTYNIDKTYPQTGWGQVFGDYFTDGAVIENRSMGGRSLKSYNNDGRLDKILTQMCPGDYVLIQFGHNDGSSKPERYIAPEDFKILLEQKYIGEIQKRGGIPIVMTPTPNFNPDENGKFAVTNTVYAGAALETAEKCGVLSLDIQQAIADRWNVLGQDKVRTFYFINEPLESAAYPAGTDDHTHFKEAGAREVAQIIAGELKKQVKELSGYIQDTENVSGFTDTKGHWAENEIAALTKLGLVKGVSDDKFAPEQQVTRAEFLSMAMRAAGINGHAYREGECLDAAAADWYRFDLQSAVDKQIIPKEMIENYQQKTVKTEADGDNAASEKTVTEGTFNGDKPITREEMAAIALMIADYSNASLSAEIKSLSFADAADFSEWTQEYHVMERISQKPYALMRGFAESDGLVFKPQTVTTRAQACAVVQRLYDVVQNKQ